MTNGLGGFSVELVGVFVGGGRVEVMAKSTRVMGGAHRVQREAGYFKARWYCLQWYGSLQIILL